MSNNKGFSIIEVVLALLALSFVGTLGWYVWHKQANENNPKDMVPQTEVESDAPNAAQQKYPTDKNWDNVELTAADYQRKQDVLAMPFKVAAYRVSHGAYPANAAEAQAIQGKDPLLDPDTKQPYKLTDAEPAIGEMQYKLSATCDSTNRNLVTLNSQNIFAFVVRLSEGSTICKSNIR